MYQYQNNNPLGNRVDDCTIRAISCATNRTWDRVYDELSDLARYNGTMMNERTFVRWYLDSHYTRLPRKRITVGHLAEMYPHNVLLITVPGHITCAKFGTVYDSFDCLDSIVEDAWVVN